MAAFRRISILLGTCAAALQVASALAMEPFSGGVQADFRPGRPAMERSQDPEAEAEREPGAAIVSEDPGSLRDTLSKIEERIRSAEAEKAVVSGELTATRKQLSEAIRYLEDLRREEDERTARLAELATRLSSFESRAGSASLLAVTSAAGSAHEVSANLRRLSPTIESATPGNDEMEARKAAALHEAAAAESDLLKLRESLAAAKSEQAALAQRNENLRSELAPLQAQLADRRSELAKLGAAAEEQKLSAADATARLDAAREELLRMESELTDSRGVLETSKAQEAELFRRIEGAREELASLDEQVAARRAALTEVEGAAERQEASAANAEARLQEAQAKFAELAEELEKAESARGLLVQEIGEVRTRAADEQRVLDELSVRRQQVQSQLQESEAELNSRQAALAIMVDEEARLRVAVADLDEAASAFRQALKADGKQVAELVSRRDQISASIRSLEEQVQAAEARRGKLLTSIASLQKEAEAAEAAIASPGMERPFFLNAAVDGKAVLRGISPATARTASEQPQGAPPGKYAVPLPPTSVKATDPQPHAGPVAGLMEAAPAQRTRSAVQEAMRQAPGLSEASPDDFTALERLLRDGTCATDALREVFGGINRQTLVALVREFGAC